MVDLCDNGRRCGYGKVSPCQNAAIHYICVTDGTADRPAPIKLCNDHFTVALSLGLITRPFMGKEVFDQNERERQEQE